MLDAAAPPHFGCCPHVSHLPAVGGTSLQLHVEAGAFGLEAGNLILQSSSVLLGYLELLLHLRPD